MAEKKQGIDWSTLWKKDDWMAVWIGFLILIIFMLGATVKLPGWRWYKCHSYSFNPRKCRCPLSDQRWHWLHLQSHR